MGVTMKSILALAASAAFAVAASANAASLLDKGADHDFAVDDTFTSPVFSESTVIDFFYDLSNGTTGTLIVVVDFDAGQVFPGPGTLPSFDVSVVDASDLSTVVAPISADSGADFNFLLPAGEMYRLVIDVTGGNKAVRYQTSVSADLIADPVPVPAALPLFGAAVAGFAASRRKKKA